MMRGTTWRAWIVLGIVSGVALLARTADAGTLYATDVYGSASHLYSVNTSTGVLTDIGTLHTSDGRTPIKWGSALTFDAAGTLWCVDGWNWCLAKVNPANAELTIVSPVRDPSLVRGFISGIAFNPVTKILYASLEGTGFYAIDTTAGTFSPLVMGGTTPLAALSYGNDGQLYGVNYGGAIYRVDPNNGFSLTAVGFALGAGGNLHYVRDITAMSDAAGVSFFAETDMLGGNGGLAELVLGSPNTYTYTGTGVSGLSGRNVDGLAYRGDDPPPAVPEPSSFALAFGLGTVALAVGWRRRAA